MKTTLSTCICGYLVLLFSFCVYGKKFEIHKSQDFVSFANSVREGGSSQRHDAILMIDLDFNDPLTSPPLLPVGVDDNGHCTAYRGLFDGNGHTIKNLVVDKLNNTLFDGSGLFCDLNDAEIRNLIMDRSCSFRGSTAGSISAKASGSFILYNIINKGNVCGGIETGGLIGRITDAWDSHILIDNCLNINGIQNNNNASGGVIGVISRNTKCNITINNTTNNGNLTSDCGGLVGRIENNEDSMLSFMNCTNNGSFIITEEKKPGMAGGFAGVIDSNTGMTMMVNHSVNYGSISVTDTTPYAGGFFANVVNNSRFNFTLMNSVNKGTIESNGGFFGGFIGLLRDNPNLTLNMINDINDAFIIKNDGKDYSIAGGFIGQIQEATQISVVINNGFNNGSVTSQSHSEDRAGGFIGLILMDIDAERVNIIFKNCENNGTIIGEKVGAGFYSRKKNGGIFTADLFNCINKGTISANPTYQYGIADEVTHSKNIVSMGNQNVNITHPFWSKCVEHDSIFRLGECNGMSNICRAFVELDGHYITSDRKRVDEELNKECIKSGYEQGWNKNLDIFSYHVYLGFPFERTVNVIPGLPLSSSNHLPERWEECHWFEQGNTTQYDFYANVTKDLILNPFQSVVIQDWSIAKWVRTDSELGSGIDPSLFSLLILTEVDKPNISLDKSFIVSNDMIIAARDIASVGITLDNSDDYSDSEMAEILIAFIRSNVIAVKEFNIATDANVNTLLVVVVPLDEVDHLIDLFLHCQQETGHSQAKT